MAWQRFNRTTNVFEVSDNNGASWTTLVIAAAGLGSPALPANIAYTNIQNVFTAHQILMYNGGTGYNVGQLEIQAPTPRVSFHWPGIIASQIGMDSAGVIRTYDNPGTGYEGFACKNIYSSDAGNNLGDLTVRGNTNFQNGVACSGGNITTPGSIVVTGSIQSGAPIYPAGGVTGGPQASWYFGAHSSYGIYCNTGLYLESAVWTHYIEARAHIRAAGGLYDYGRGNPIGVWTSFALQLYDHGGGAMPMGSVWSAIYMVIGKTMFISIFCDVSAYTEFNTFYFYIPGGYASSATGGMGGISMQGNNFISACAVWNPYDVIRFFSHPDGGGALPAGNVRIAASFFFPIV